MAKETLESVRQAIMKRRSDDFMALRAMARQSEADPKTYPPGWVVGTILTMAKEQEKYIVLLERLLQEDEKKG